MFLIAAFIFLSLPVFICVPLADALKEFGQLISSVEDERERMVSSVGKQRLIKLICVQDISHQIKFILTTNLCKVAP